MKRQFFVLFFPFLLLTLFIYSISTSFFFWDTIHIVSLPAHFFYENNFSKLILPDRYDSGHLPAFSMYLAVVWNFFSKSLIVSHFAIFPFVIGILYQAYLLIGRIISNQYYILIVLLLTLIEPTFLSQIAVVSPDIPMLFFFLLGINSIKTKKEGLFSLAIIGLFLMSMRGAMSAVALLIVELIIDVNYNGVKSIIKQLSCKSLKYLPGAFIFFGFHFYHYQQTGWAMLHEDSPWAPTHVANDLSGAIYNIGIFIWRLIDSGRLFVWIVLLFILIRYRNSIIKDKKIQPLIFYILALLFLFFTLFMKYKYFTLHRYLSPIYFLVTIFTGYLIVEFIKSNKLKKVLFGFCFIGLITGNFWVYPAKVAQGWDSTLAHLPYYSLQQKMLTYLNEQNIEINGVGAEFPALEKQDYIMLNGNNNALKKQEVGSDIYIVYSNVNNDFSDEELDSLQINYSLKKEFKSMQIVVQLYEKMN